MERTAHPRLGIKGLNIVVIEFYYAAYAIPMQLFYILLCIWKVHESTVFLDDDNSAFLRRIIPLAISIAE